VFCLILSGMLSGMTNSDLGICIGVGGGGGGGLCRCKNSTLNIIGKNF
jgi:hypothetical protein